MSATPTPTTAKRKIGFMTLLSSVFIIAMIVWGTYTIILIQAGEVRQQTPHTNLDDVPPWIYDLNWNGGRSNWFDNINYTDLPLDQMLPEDLLAQMNNTLFVVEPADPAQLWRSSAYDSYDGSGWSKTLIGSTPLAATPRAQAINEIYTISMNVTVSPNIEPIELPSLFPNIRVIENSFRTFPAGRLIDYELETDQYDTLLFSPFLSGSLDETILISYDITYDTQDVNHIETHARSGDFADAEIQRIYGDVGVTLSQTVIDEITPFETVGNTAYEKAMAVDVFFRNNYQLLIDSENITQRPQGQELTEWFIERGGGLPMDFATAYCVFMRYLGIPARMTLGYAIGEPDPDGGDFRLVQVKHMMFWAEVYIPQDDGPGQWIQVIPLPLPPGFGGGALPENFDEADVSLLVFTQPWVEIGTDFNIYAILYVNGVPVNTPENIRFYDLTEGVDIGIATIEPALIPFANITHQFPPGSSVGAHNISAMWVSSTFLIANYTSIIAVGQSNPFQAPPSQTSTSFIPSEIIDINISLALDTYVAHWNDTLRVHGVMRISGVPANGTELGLLGNNQMWIMWDGLWYGNATIGDDGYYELDIIVDGTDIIRMTLEQHNVSAFFAGIYDKQTGFPIVFPGQSANSVVTLRGSPGFYLTVAPINTYGGGSITYEGIAYLFNGTPLVGETIGILFDGSIIDTAITNATGGFNYVYNIPLLHPSGVFDAAVNWTSTYPQIDGATSSPIAITIQSGSTTLTIDSTPKDPYPVHIYETITIFGTLTVSSDGTPLIGRTIEIWWDWNNGTVQLIGTNTTIAGGFYEFSYNIPAGSEGTSTYWTEWDASAEPNYQDGISSTMDIVVKRYDIIVIIDTIQSSVVVGEELDIQGFVYLPEIPAVLGGAHLTLWWQNGTGTHNITGVYTSVATGIYTFNYTVPVTHELAGVQLWAEYISESPMLSSNISLSLGVVVRNYYSYISILSNTSIVHLNESVLIYGFLQHENGTPLAGLDVDIQWNNGTSYWFQVVTNSSGWYEFLYNCSPSTDSEGIVTVSAYHTSIDPSYSSSSASLSPALTLQLYQLTLDADVVSNNVHLDEVIQFSGTLTLDVTGTPIAGATIVVYYQNSTGTYTFPKVTDFAGGFFFQYNCSLNDALGAVYVWAQYTSLNPLWDNAISLNRTVNLILYSMTLTTNTDSVSYFIDDTVYIWGQLTYTHNSTPLPGQLIQIYWYNGSIIPLGSFSTNSSGYFEYFYTLQPGKDSEGFVTVWATFATSVPLWDDADSTPGTTFSVNKYAVIIDVTVVPNLQYLNRSITIQAHIYFSHNATNIAGASLSLWWQNASIYLLSTGFSDGSGNYQFIYSGMDDDTFLTGIQIFANYSGSAYLQNAQSSPQSLTLQRWLTLITGFDTGGVTTFLLTDTLVVTGTLFYDLTGPDVPYGGAIVQILVDGSVVNTTTTASDGTFIGYWEIPDITPVGNYDISVRHLSSVNWIADYTSSPISISIQAITIIWIFEANPTIVYRSEWLNISGILSLSNGSPYAGASVQLYWLNTITATGQILLDTVSTDAGGRFEYWYLLSDTEDLGPTQIWAECSSGVPIIGAGMSSVELIDVMQIPVNLTGGGSHTLIYLGDTITFSGTLTFGNGTPMVGYGVEVIWDGITLVTITITDGISGSFSYDYYLDYDEPVRTLTYYIQFAKPSEAYSDAQTASQDLEIRDLITIAIDSQTVFSIIRGDTLQVTGLVANSGGPDVGVPLELLLNGGQAGIYAISDTFGEFSFNFQIRRTYSPGIYNISVGVNSLNYDVTGSSGYWIIQLNITSEISVTFLNPSDIMPGETFTISFTILDDDGNTPVGEQVSIYLLEENAGGPSPVLIAIVDILPAGQNIHTLTISLGSWTGNGLYFAEVRYSGSQFVVGSSDSTSQSIHVFADAGFVNLGPGIAVPAQPITLTGNLLDLEGIPIKNRSITLTLNDSSVVTLTTGTDGSFRYDLPVTYSGEATYTYRCLFLKADGSRVEATHTFPITSGFGPGFSTALLITWAVIIAIEAMAAMLIVARFRYGKGFGLGRLGFRARATEIHDSLVG
ncbi:MAG: transglutaminase family protein [Candidatus Thorarchaeota archaeon]